MKIWARLINSVYCNVDDHPPHLVEVELTKKDIKKIIRAAGIIPKEKMVMGEISSKKYNRELGFNHCRQEILDKLNK